MEQALVLGGNMIGRLAAEPDELQTGVARCRRDLLDPAAQSKLAGLA